MPSFVWDSGAYLNLATGETEGGVPEGWVPFYVSDLSVDDGWTLREETQSNDNSFNTPDNVLFGERGMVILGKRENRGGRPYTSGDALGQHIAVPNYFRAEVDATLPTDVGMWPAPLWFRPLNGPDGEIDACETWPYDWNGDPRFYVTVHSDYDTGTHQGAILSYSELPNPDPAARHTYVVEKLPNYLGFWCDGVLVYLWTDPSNHPQMPWWDDIYENPSRTWYPRVTLQIGGSTNAEPPTEWQESEIVISGLRIYVPEEE